MKLSLDTIRLNQINFYTVSTFFLFSLFFFVIKSFVRNEEASDWIFVVTSIVIFELIFLVLINNFNNIYIKNRKNFIIYFLFFFLTYFLWNYQLSKEIAGFLYFVLFQILFLFLLILFEHKNYGSKIISLDKFFTYLTLIFLCSGIFYQIEENIIYNVTLLGIITIIFFSILRISEIFIKKKYFIIDLFISIIFFLVFFKAFLLSSEKDSFHYSWYLGPASSSMAGSNLLVDTVSQYGYFSILFIEYFSKITNFNLSTSLIILIILFFIIFFIIFIYNFLKVLNYPKFILTIFTCVLIFGSIGISNLSGSMLIPSSSVYRFFPSLLTVLLLSNLIILDNKNKRNFYLNSVLFFSFLTISICWSFESLFFVTFSISSLLFLQIFYHLYSKYLKKNSKEFFFKNKKNLIFLSFLITLFSLIILFSFYGKDISLFYEYVIGLEGVKTVQIINNRTSLLFIFFLLLSYLILRDSFKMKNMNIFFYNFLWSALLMSFSTYYIVRSHPNNAFALFPFFIFFICILKISSKELMIYRTIFLKIFLIFTIISSTVSIYKDHKIFTRNLLSSNFLKLPIYNYKNYQPGNLLKAELNKFNNIPVTLISGSTIHNYNKQLNSGGYGLAILPLEQFNILKNNRKELLMNKFFHENREHLLLCLVECNFYNQENERKTWNSIYVTKKIKIKKILDFDENDVVGRLYLLSLE